MDMRELVSELLDRLADEARDAGRLEREKDIMALGAEEARAQLAAVQRGHVSAAQVEALLSASARGLKINVIKEIRAMTNLGLKDAKDLYERVYPPTTSF